MTVKDTAIPRLKAYLNKGPRPGEEEEFFDGFAPLLLSIAPERYPGLRNVLLGHSMLCASFIACIANIAHGYDEDILEHIDTWLDKAMPDEDGSLVAIEEWYEEAHDNATDHFIKHHQDGDILGAAGPGPTAGSVQLVILIQDAQGQLRVWDTAVLKTHLAPIDVAISMSLSLGDTITLSQHKLHHGITPGPLFHYHPERFKQTRRYVKSISNARARSADEAMAAMNHNSMLMIKDLNARQLESSLHERLNGDYNPQLMITREIEILELYRDFTLHGRHIFDLGASLADMLCQTSVDDIPVTDLVSPYKSYFIHFGNVKDLAWTNGEGYFDGCYVQHLPEHRLLQLGFVSSYYNKERTVQWWQYPARSVVISISEEMFSLSLGEAVEKILKEWEHDIDVRIAQGDRDISDELSLDEISVQGVQIVHASKTNALAAQSEMDAIQQGLGAALSLAVNAMCYLTAYPDDVATEWQTGTPRSMLDKAKRETAKARKSTYSKLESMGYRRIHFAGRALHQGPAVIQSGGNRKRAHWRRGHWRMQAHGEGRTLRRMVLIKPMLINSTSGEAPLGSIYIGENVVDMKSEKRARER